MEVLKNEIVAVQKFGRIVLDTKYGKLEYSYNVGSDYDDMYQLEEGDDSKLTDEESDEISDLMRVEMYKFLK